jgi:hypothetical protein
MNDDEEIQQWLDENLETRGHWRFTLGYWKWWVVLCGYSEPGEPGQRLWCDRWRWHRGDHFPNRNWPDTYPWKVWS